MAELPKVSQLLSNLGIQLRSHHKNPIGDRLEQLGNCQRSKGCTRMADDEHYRVVQIPSIFTDAMTCLSHRNLQAIQTQQFVGRDGLHDQMFEAEVEVCSHLLPEP